MYGKFGHLHVFTRDYSPNQWDPIGECYNHKMEGYMEAVNSVSTVRPCVQTDLNGNGAADPTDARALFTIVCSGQTAQDAEELDVNGDGKVNNRDAMLLFRYAMQSEE